MPWAAHKLKCSASHRPHPNYPQAMGKWGQSMDSLKKKTKKTPPSEQTPAIHLKASLGCSTAPKPLPR